MGQQLSKGSNLGENSDFHKSTKALLDKHFGPESDFQKRFGGNKTKALTFEDALANDDRLFSSTKEAIQARNSDGANKYSAQEQAEWSGPLPKSIQEAVLHLERMVQGVNVRITRKKDNWQSPVVIYLHGGSFAAGSFSDAAYTNYISRLAALNKCVIISVDYASAADNDKSFEDALTDCCRVAQAAANGKITGVKGGPVLLAGNSTGGMVALATAIKANQEGWMNMVSGIYTICPFVDGVVRDNKYPSMTEFNGYHISEQYLQNCLKTIETDMRSNPKLFPITASKDDLKGLPPTKIIVYQLDMLRDMGIAMHFKLMKAGVEASFHIISGGVHDQQLFTAHSPEVTESSIHDLGQFSNYAGAKAGLIIQSTAETKTVYTSTMTKQALLQSERSRSTTPEKGRGKSSKSKSGSVISTEKLINGQSNSSDPATQDEISVRSSRSSRSAQSATSKSEKKKNGSWLSRPPPPLESRKSGSNTASNSSVDSTIAATSTVVTAN